MLFGAPFLRGSVCAGSLGAAGWATAYVDVGELQYPLSRVWIRSGCLGLRIEALM